MFLIYNFYLQFSNLIRGQEPKKGLEEIQTHFLERHRITLERILQEFISENLVEEHPEELAESPPPAFSVKVLPGERVYSEPD